MQTIYVYGLLGRNPCRQFMNTDSLEGLHAENLRIWTPWRDSMQKIYEYGLLGRTPCRQFINMDSLEGLPADNLSIWTPWKYSSMMTIHKYGLLGRTPCRQFTNMDSLEYCSERVLLVTPCSVLIDSSKHMDFTQELTLRKLTGNLHHCKHQIHVPCMKRIRESGCRA